MNIEVENLRITKLREYLLKVIDELTQSQEYQINVDMLSNDIDNYSLDKINTTPIIETWITGEEIHKDVYSFRSRCAYSQDTINNLRNIGFFEIFESMIKTNNEKGVLPEIENVESIRCLNCGTLLSSTTNTAEFDIQIQIDYRMEV